ncbi:MAG: hypothetical protein OXG11_07425 [Chloroflexi bacterium]|nr:hypothetical protein [Chloroflexota bacterium]
MATLSYWTTDGTRPKRARLTERRRRALELRIRGMTFAEIAHEVGYASPSGAYEAVKAALDSAVFDAADEYRKLHVARLEALLNSIWNAAREGKLGAIDRALKVLERQAKLLGLDVSQQSQEPPEKLPGKVWIDFPWEDI